MNDEDIAELSTLLGLKPETVKDLVENGWAYEAKLYYPRAFYDSKYKWKNEEKSN